ncbi:MAG: MBL fold metallo-hydrolase, partial [Actinomycetota bacterium]
MASKPQSHWRSWAVATLVMGAGAGLCFPDLPQATAEIIPRASLPGIGAFLFQPPPVLEPLRIYHLDVGQGDATLIVGPGSVAERKVLVVDGGDPVQSANFDGGLRFLQALRKLGIRSLDHVFVSHYDYDHIGGFVGGDRGREASILLGEDGAAGLRGVDDDSDGQVDWTNAARTVPDRE